MTEVVVDVAIGTAIIAVTAWHWYTRGRSDEQWRCPRCGGLHSYRATGWPHNLSRDVHHLSPPGNRMRA